MENLNTIILVFLVVNTLFVFRQRLWHKSISTPIIILASDVAYALYRNGLIEWSIIAWGTAITGLVLNSAIREQKPCCNKKI
jgi:hypothetical protein